MAIFYIFVPNLASFVPICTHNLNIFENQHFKMFLFQIWPDFDFFLSICTNNRSTLENQQFFKKIVPNLARFSVIFLMFRLLKVLEWKPCWGQNPQILPMMLGNRGSCWVQDPQILPMMHGDRDHVEAKTHKYCWWCMVTWTRVKKLKRSETFLFLYT